MRLHRVLLQNYGLFAGENWIEFAPTQPKNQNISLIAGMNGTGKTTFLEAVQLALYGKGALGQKVSQSDYIEHLRGRIHRGKEEGVELDRASVGLEFDHETMGTASRYRIRRRWVALGSGVSEELEVHKDGEILEDVDKQYWQDFVRELVPPGVSQLFFFDGEKIQRLADDEDNDAVAEAIKSLLGLDLVERLQDDLSIYRSRQLKKSGSDMVLKELEKSYTKLADLKRRLAALKVHRGDLVSDIQGKNGQVAQAEKSLALQGGRFAENREELKVERAVVTERLEKSEESIRELVETALPFAFCSSLFGRLMTQLQKEEEAKKGAAVRNWTTEKMSALRLRASNLGLSEQSLKAIEQELIEGLPEVEEPVHGLSSDSERRLGNWFEEAEGFLSERLRTHSFELEESTRILQSAEKKLRQVPEEDALKTRVEALHDIIAQKAEKEMELKRVDESFKSLELEIENVKREVARAEETIRLDEEQSKRLNLLDRCRDALESYQNKLTTAKVEKLGEQITSCFHHLHRKGDLVHRIQVDPATCGVQLFASDGTALSKKELSAGEKQMYAVAMLWGLALTSGRKLPLIIDTPLGRLDSAHRDNLVERYFPHAADQVIILSTDTEIDKSYYESLVPYVAHAYRLEFNKEFARTEIQSGYFWRESETCHA